MLVLEKYRIIGRVINIKKKKNNTFIMIKNTDIYQIVVKKPVWVSCECDRIRLKDIIDVYVEEDKENNCKYKPNIQSYVARIISIYDKSVVKNVWLEKYYENVVCYSEAKSRVRNYLSKHGYIEVNVPVLTDGEISSKSDSFKTSYSKTGKTLFLRKTMDSFLRMYSCNDYNRIYSIGYCFRNEYITSINSSEFEMLSIFSNYISIDDGIELAKDILQQIINKEVQFRKMRNEEYENRNNNGFIIVNNIPNDSNSFSEIDNNGILKEFKIKYNGITIVHGVKEISTYEKYIDKIKIQGKKENYGELEKLEYSLLKGAPPCINIGISIVRLLALYNEKKIKEYDPLSLYRLNMKK